MTPDNLNTLFFCSFRYALGRKTYIVQEICHILKNNAENIHPDTRSKMAQEIILAMAGNEAGMDADVCEWANVLECFGNIAKKLYKEV